MPVYPAPLAPSSANPLKMTQQSKDEPQQQGAPPIVAFDESGNSGGNLLDIDQPVFCLASVCLPEADALTLCGSASQELKFSSLRNSREGREQILAILNSTLLPPSKHFFSAFHKRFIIVTKIVDMLVEPLAHVHGVDLYDRGGNLGLANLWYHTLPVFLGPGTFRLLLDRFVAMVRRPDTKTLDKFYALIETAYRKHQGEVYHQDIGMLLATKAVALAHMTEFDSSDLDPAIPAFAEHASEWTSRLKGPFRIVHDASKPIENEQILLEAMMSVSEPAQEIGYDRRKMTFPFASREIEFADSRQVPALQIADVIAGSANYCLRMLETQPDEPFAKILLATSVLDQPRPRVWPEFKVTPADLDTDESGGVDSLEHIGDYVARRLGGIPPKGQRRKNVD